MSDAPTLIRDGSVFTLNLGGDENRMNPAWLDAVEAALTEIEAAQGPTALVTTATGKFWTNGLDLGWLMQNPGELDGFTKRVHSMLSRFLTLGVPTAAAISGHAFGAGAMLAVAHDYRVMRSDRGYFCFPEVDIHIPFTPGMNDLIVSKLAPPTAHTAMTTGRRYSGADAAAAGIVDVAVPEDEVGTAAVAWATELAPKASPTMRAIKERLYRQAVTSLQD